MSLLLISSLFGGFIVMIMFAFSFSLIYFIKLTSVLIKKNSPKEVKPQSTPPQILYEKPKRRKAKPVKLYYVENPPTKN